jgi:hypothetical protein
MLFGFIHIEIYFYMQYTKDSEPIVADSCIVALDMLDHELSGNFEYCAA